MAISQNFPNTRPSLNLNFARSKTLDPRITFIRTQTGSEASYVDESGIIRYASADEPRFDHDPETGRCLGLMIEEQQTNVLLYSEEFDTGWTNTNASVTANATTAPDGTTTADKLVENSSTGNKEVNQGNITYTSGTSLTFSCFAKAGERTRFRLAATTARFDSSTNAYFDLSAGTVVTTTGGFTSASIEAYPNGWYRCVGTMLPTSSGTNNVFITLVNTGTNTGYTGDGSSGVFIWGAQLEADKDVSSYIPTTNATVTRNSDNAYFDDISDFFNINEGTAVFTYSPRFDGVYNDSFASLFNFSSTANSNKIGFAGNSNNSQLYFNNYSTLIDGGSFTWLTPGVPTRNVIERILVSYASTYLRMYANEEAPASTGSFNRDDLIPLQVSGISTYTSSMDGLVFGSGSKGTANGKVNLNIETFVYYPSEVGISNGKTLSKNP